MSRARALCLQTNCVKRHPACYIKSSRPIYPSSSIVPCLAACHDGGVAAAAAAAAAARHTAADRPIHPSTRIHTRSSIERPSPLRLLISYLKPLFGGGGGESTTSSKGFFSFGVRWSERRNPRNPHTPSVLLIRSSPLFYRHRHGKEKCKAD